MANPKDADGTAAWGADGAAGGETELVPPATVADPAHAWSREEPATVALSRPWRSVWVIAGIGLLCAVVVALAILGVVALVRDDGGATPGCFTCRNDTMGSPGSPVSRMMEPQPDVSQVEP